MTLRLNGSTSGYVEIDAPAVAGSGLLTLPTGSGTVATEAYVAAADLAAGGLVHINTTTFSAVSSVSVNNVFTGTFDNYFINYFINVTLGSPNLDLRLRVAGVDSSTSNYTRQILAADGAATSAAKVTTTLLRVNGLSIDSIATGQINIFRPAIAVKTGFNCYGDGAYQSANLNLTTGSNSLATAFDGFSFIASASTITGTLRVYGYKNS